MMRAVLEIESDPKLGKVLDFMRLVWAVDHGLQRVSKRMLSEYGVTGLQRMMIRIVGRFPGMSAGELASILHVHPSTLTGVLQRLVAQRMLVRVAAPRDRRRAVLRLTPRGARVNAKRRGTIEAAVAAALAQARPADRLAARRVLQRLAEHLGANAAALTARARARNAARRGGTPRRRS